MISQSIMLYLEKYTNGNNKLYGYKTMLVVHIFMIIYLITEKKTYLNGLYKLLGRLT